MGWIRNRFFFCFKKKEKRISELLANEELLLLKSKKWIDIFSWIQSNLKGFQGREKILAVLDFTRNLKWPISEIKMLEIMLYSTSEIPECLDKCFEKIGLEKCDEDLIVVVILSLYTAKYYSKACEFINFAFRAKKYKLWRRSDFITNAALVAFALNRDEDCVRCLRRARKIAFNNIDVAFCAYGIFFELGELDCFNQIRRQIESGEFSSGRFALTNAVIELACGNYAKGFSLMEVRYESNWGKFYLNNSLFKYPRWKGECIPGKTLLLSAEQGLGDTIQMARYLPMILGRYALKIVMEVQPEALSLLQFNFPDIEMVCCYPDTEPKIYFDYWTSLMGLPYIFATEIYNVPGKFGYLKVPTESSYYWKDRILEISQRRFRIGFAWSGNPAHPADRRRSIPFDLVVNYVKNVNADFFILQKNLPDCCPNNFYDISEEIISLADTAAVIDEMDLIVTVDTSVVHIAGAINKKTWLLLPYRYEWRWGLEGEGNYWYDSVTVLRQRKHGDWDELLEYVFNHKLLGLLQ